MSEKDMKEAKYPPCLVRMLYRFGFPRTVHARAPPRERIAGIKAEAALHKGHIRLLSCTKSKLSSPSNGLAHLRLARLPQPQEGQVREAREDLLD